MHMRSYSLAAGVISLLLALPAALLASAPVLAAREPPTLLAQAAPAMSAAEAAALVSARTGGRVLDVRAEQRGEQVVYRVKVLLEGGRVRVVRVDAESGRLSE